MSERERLTLAEVLEAYQVLARLAWEQANPPAQASVTRDHTMNLKDTARFLGVSQPFVKTAITRGELQAARLSPRVYRVKASDAEAFRRERETA